MLNDDRIAALRGILLDRVHHQAPRDDELREAGVMVVLRHAEPLEMLIIKRAEQEGDPWSGHMALPGGRRESRDRDLVQTAIRETWEETGIRVRPRHVLGALDEVAPRSRRPLPIVVAPYVAVVPGATEPDPDPREVERALWIPVAHLSSDDAVSEVLVDLEDGTRAFPSLTYRDHVIWGLTHRVLTGFLELAGRAGILD